MLKLTLPDPRKAFRPRHAFKLGTDSSLVTNMASEEALPALIPSLKYTKPAINGEQLPPVRGGHGCVLADMQLVIFGGHAYLGKGEFEYLNDVWCLDIQSLTWQKVYPHGQGEEGRPRGCVGGGLMRV